MNKVFNVLILTLMISSLFSCSEDSKSDPVTPTTADNRQTVVLNCVYQTSYRDSNGVMQNIPNVQVSGKFFGEKYPEFINCKVNGISKTRMSKYFGYTKFGDLDNYKLIPVTDNLELLNIEISSDLGTVSGQVSLPDIPGPLQLNTTDTLALNSPLTASWSASNCNLYRVRLTYKYETYYTKKIDTLTTANNITFPGSYFGRNGKISFISVSSYNGSIPGSCAEANLTGNGQGFATYTTISREYEGEDIIVGNGK